MATAGNNTLENETDENLIRIIRTAMEQGCIRPSHVYDAVDEVLCRLEKYVALHSLVRNVTKGDRP